MTTCDSRTAAAITSRSSPDVAVETDDDGDDHVYVEGTAFHDGLNKNAWGLTEQGARAIADSLVGCDHTASHPALRQAGDAARYDRPVHGGQGAPIGEVVSTEVVTADEAMLRDGGYTVKYISEIKDETAKQRYRNGLLTGDGYGVSVGIYGNPDAAVCSVCTDQMAECDHDRFDEVVRDDADGDGEPETQIAGPLYDEAESDHLASVYLPAYDDADASVATTIDGNTATAADATAPAEMTALAASYDATGGRDGDDDPAAGDGTDSDEDADDDSYYVRTAAECCVRF